jgi:hypothetical protein
MSRYGTLTEHLLASNDPVVSLTFEELDNLVGGLPESAKKYGAWWANSRTSHGHSGAWLDAGRKVSLDFRSRVATFRLDPTAAAPESESEELVEAQGLLSGFVESSISLERDLEDHLVAHLDLLEPGLTLITRQATTDVGRVDILARSVKGDTVIIELKVGEARDSAIGQVARYIGWYARSESKTPRAILVAGAFSDPVRYGASALPSLRLVSYRVSFEFEDVSL